jgi:hypothetical protein
MRPSSRYPSWVILAAGVLALPAAARAQQPLAPVHVSDAMTKADRLDARAAAYMQSGSLRDLGKAAGLREKAASLRALEDPRGFTGLEAAAFMRHALKQRPAALSLMQRAAEQAMARGDVFNAATAYVNTAFIAVELRDVDLARRSVERSTLLMHSPLLSVQQRDALRRTVAAVSAPGPDLALLTKP